MNSKLKFIDINPENVLNYGLCGYKNIKRDGFPQKIEWLKSRQKEGMIIKGLFCDKEGTQGMIEYLPGEYCWRPVNAKGYMFIHCLFVGFKKEYKNKGYASNLINACIKDAKAKKMKGVAVVTRKGSFMANDSIFLKNGFEIVDTAPTDFQLLVKKFNKSTPNPSFKKGTGKDFSAYNKGLTILRADQCPYTVKNVNEIVETAKTKYKLKPKVVTLDTHKEAQENPCAFGTFALIFKGKILAEHPISNGRFRNIMEKLKQ